jgi:RpiR family carbohydrate utilization transcriptional regulator
MVNPRGVLALTMAGLADLSDVSEPTVMRFCNAMGTPGFSAFKLRLAGALALGLPAAYAAIEQGDSTPQLVTKVFDQTITSLDRARRAVDVGRVDEAIALLESATHAIFVGFGASGIVAQDAEQKFPLFGIPCTAPIDAHQQFIAASMSGPGSVLVALSNTGRTQAILDVVREAQKQGASVIGITGDHSPLLEIADVPLLVQTFEDTDFHTPTVSRIAALVLIDILATGVALRRPPQHLQRLARMKKDLTTMREGPAPRRRLVLKSPSTRPR